MGNSLMEIDYKTLIEKLRLKSDLLSKEASTALEILLMDRSDLLVSNKAMQARLDAYANGTASECARASNKAATEFLQRCTELQQELSDLRQAFDRATKT